MWSGTLRNIGRTLAPLSSPHNVQAVLARTRVGISGRGLAPSLGAQAQQQQQQAAARLHTHVGLRLDGVRNISGILQYVDPKREDLFPSFEALPKESIPDSIDLLLKYKQPVNPAVLLSDLPWDQLLASRLTPELRAQVVGQRDELQKMASRGHLVGAPTAKKIVAKVNGWMTYVELDTILSQPPAARDTITQVLKSSDSSWAKFDSKLSTVKRLLEEERWDIAYKLANATIRTCDRFGAALSAAQANLESERRERGTAVTAALVAGSAVGAVAVVGILSNYLGVIDNFSLLTPATVSSLSGLAMCGSVALLSLSSVLWITSRDASALYKSVLDAKSHFSRFASCMEEAKDDADFGREGFAV